MEQLIGRDGASPFLETLMKRLNSFSQMVKLVFLHMVESWIRSGVPRGPLRCGLVLGRGQFGIRPCKQWASVHGQFHLHERWALTRAREAPYEHQACPRLHRASSTCLCSNEAGQGKGKPYVKLQLGSRKCLCIYLGNSAEVHH